MKRTLLVLLSCLSVVGMTIQLTATPVSAQPAGVARQSVVLNPQPGLLLFSPTLPYDYRKSPAIIAKTDSELYRWDCGPGSPGTSGSQEVIRFSESLTGGNSWGAATKVITPNSTGSTAFGTCDPSVVKIGAYYYLAYTGEDYTARHRIFVARSTAPSGPYVKWGTTGWGQGNAKAIIDAYGSGYGVGGPSLVLNGSTLSVYYGYHDATGPGGAYRNWQTRLSTVDVGANPDTWPGLLQDQGTVIEHPGDDPTVTCFNTTMTDSVDVKYVDSLNKYVAVTSDAKTYKLSTVQTYESTDGVHFTKSITKRGDFQPFTQNVSLFGSESGHIPAGAGTAIAYSTGDNVCPPKYLRSSSIQLTTATTGRVNESLTTSAANWTERSGNWYIDSSTSAYRLSSNLSTNALTTLNNRQLGDTATIDVDFSVDTGYAGVQFGQINPTDTFNDSGYLVKIDYYGNVSILKAGFGVMATGMAQVHDPFPGLRHLRIVQSNGHIAVYVGGTNSVGTASPAVSAVDADAPYLGGYLGFAATKPVLFRGLKITDNVPNSYTSDDFTSSSGSWTVASDTSTITNNDPSGGQVVMQDDSQQTGGFASGLGDGTYTATVKLGAGSDPNAWGGLNLTNASTQRPLRWDQGGYLVFIRRNGNLGLYKAGSAQVVPDVATGLNPVNVPVNIRVVKHGPWFQVYVNDGQLPSINYADGSGAAPSLGGFGLATLAATGTFTGVQYAANNPS